MTPDNPWMLIPLADYESHMALPAVAQARLLAKELADAVRRAAARSIAVVGCSGGNGFADLPDSVSRIAGIDINPAYLETVRKRYGSRAGALELYLADIQDGVPGCAPVDLVYAALIFEYVDVAKTMTVLRQLCIANGTLVAVIQVAGEAEDFVTPSPFHSLERLRSVARTRDRSELESQALSVGFSSGLENRRIHSAGGKSFDVLVFRG